MTEKTIFICDVCGSRWMHRYECEMCEKYHRKPLEIILPEYQSPNTRGTKRPGYPERITVKFDDGSTCEYKEVF